MTPTPIQIDANHFVNTFSDTTLEQANSNAVYAYKLEVAKSNASRVAEYNAAFDRYASDMNTRPDATNVLPPVPAVALVVVISEDGSPSIVPGTEHVCVTRVWTAPVVTNPNTHGMIVAGLATQAADIFTTAAVFGAPVDYRGMKFLRVA